MPIPFVEETKRQLACRLLKSIQACRLGLTERNQDPRHLLLTLQFQLGPVRHLLRVLSTFEERPSPVSTFEPLLQAFSAAMGQQNESKETKALIEAYAVLEPGFLKERVAAELETRLFPAKSEGTA